MNDYSQTGETPILSALFDRLGVSTGVSVEFGAGTGPHLSNTWGFLEQGWTSCFIEGCPGDFKKLEEAASLHTTARVLEGYVTCELGETLDDVLDELSVPAEFELLSIDIDSNDYWVWRSLRRHRPSVVVIEHNMSPRFNGNKAVAYDPALRFVTTDYFGASADALVALGKRKGYTLYAATVHNLIFVDNRYTVPALDVAAVPRFATYKFDLREPVEVDPNG